MTKEQLEAKIAWNEKYLAEGAQHIANLEAMIEWEKSHLTKHAEFHAKSVKRLAEINETS